MDGGGDEALLRAAQVGLQLAQDDVDVGLGRQRREDLELERADVARIAVAHKEALDVRLKQRRALGRHRGQVGQHGVVDLAVHAQQPHERLDHAADLGARRQVPVDHRHGHDDLCPERREGRDRGVDGNRMRPVSTRQDTAGGDAYGGSRIARRGTEHTAVPIAHGLARSAVGARGRTPALRLLSRGAVAVRRRRWSASMEYSVMPAASFLALFSSSSSE